MGQLEEDIAWSRCYDENKKCVKTWVRCDMCGKKSYKVSLMKLVSLVELVNIVELLENCEPRNTETCEPRGTSANNETNKSSLTSESSSSNR